MSPLFVILAATFGTATAAFLPRPAHRLAVAFGAPPRSACAVCSRPFPVGLAGWVRVGAACPCARGGVRTALAGGGVRIALASSGVRTALAGGGVRTALAGGGVAVVLAVRLGPSPRLPILLVAAVPALLLALIDLRCLRLPDRLVAALALVSAVPLAALAPERLGAASGAAVAVLIPYGIFACLTGGGLGLGDVKLAAVLALILGFAGWPAVFVGVVTPHLINGPIALFLLVIRRARGGRPLPFGPALLAGALIGLTTA